MKILIEIDVNHVNGRRVPQDEVADHIIEEMLMRGEVPGEPGRFWMDDTEFLVTAARRVEVRT